MWVFFFIYMLFVLLVCIFIITVLFFFNALDVYLNRFQIPTSIKLFLFFIYYLWIVIPFIFNLYIFLLCISFFAYLIDKSYNTCVLILRVFFFLFVAQLSYSTSLLTGCLFSISVLSNLIINYNTSRSSSFYNRFYISLSDATTTGTFNINSLFCFLLNFVMYINTLIVSNINTHLWNMKTFFFKYYILY